MPAKKTDPSARRRARRTQSPAAVRGPIDQSVMQGLVGYNIRRAELRMRREFDRIVGRSRLRPSEFSILVLVHHNSLLTQAELGRALNIRRPNMVVLIEGLERRGLVARADHAHDRRMRTLCLTPKGRALLAEAKRLSAELEQKATRCWSERERVQLISLLRRFYEQG